MPDKTLSALFQLTPKEALDYLQGRDKLSQTFSWQDLWHEEHGYQFTVSRLTRLDIMQSMYDGIVKSVQGDMSRRDWMRNSRELLQQAGWWGKKSVSDPATGEVVSTTFNPNRLNLIYDTNTRIAYSAGLWERMERNKESHPYIRYISMHDSRVRPAHRAWDNVTLPVDDPFWNTHYPPNGWRCRCRVMSATQADYDSGVAPNGAPLKKTAPPITYKDWVNKRTGVVERVPAGIDPGFAFNPGKAAMRAKNLSAVEQQKLKQVAPSLAAEYRKDDHQFKQPWANGIYQYPGLQTFVPDTSTPARAAAVTIENAIRNDTLETGVFISQTGKVLLRKQGNADSVGYTAKELYTMKDSLFTHNHPMGMSFSASDLGLAVTWEIGEVRAVSGQFRYIIRPMDGKWPQLADIERLYSDALDWASPTVREMIIMGDIEPAAREMEITHQVMRYLSEKLKFNYVREAS